MYQLKRHIAILSLFVLMIPSSIQILHAFEDHEHTVCTSINDQHFHASEVDCSLMHYQLEVFSYKTTSNYAVIPQHFYKSTYNKQPQLIQTVYADANTSRGPPTFTV